MIGSGTETDPFRVPLPRYLRLIRDDETPLGPGTPRWAIVELEEAEYEPPGDGEIEITVNVPGIGVVIRGMPAAQLRRMRDRIRARYRERASSYDVEPV
jgi:hypothetical protein